MRKWLVSGAIASAMILGGGGYALGATENTSTFQQEACVHFGQAGSAAGNTMEYDYNDSACPSGTYLVHLAQYPDNDPAPMCTNVAQPAVTTTPTTPPTTPVVTTPEPSISCSN